MAYIFLLLTSVIWGIASSVIKFTLEGISPLPFLLYRFFISAIIGLVYIYVTKSYKDKHVKKEIKHITAYGLLGTTIALGALFIGLERTTVLDMSIITSTIPLIAVIAGAIIYKERVSGNERLGAFIAFIGTLIAIVLPQAIGIEHEFQLLGNIFIFLYVASDIAALLIAKELVKKHVSPGFIVNFSFIVGFITILPFVFLFGNSIENIIFQVVTLPWEYHLGVWYMAVISGTLAYYFRGKAQKKVDVGKVGLFAYLNPIFAVPLATLWLGEKITIPFTIGATLIVVGVIVAEVNRSRKHASR